MTKPTYEELDSIDMDAQAIANQNPIGTPFAWRKAYLAALADSVLVKWGTPPAVAGEPTAWYEYARKKPSLRRLVFERTSRKDLRTAGWVAEPLYATPQPTQQADGLAPKEGSIFRVLVRLTEAEVRKQDDVLIRQLVEALEYHRAQTRPIDRTDEAIRAARARLEGKP